MSYGGWSWIGVGAAFVTLGYGLRAWSGRRAALARLVRVDTDEHEASPPAPPSARSYLTRWRWVPWAAGLLLFGLLATTTPLPGPLTVAFAAIVVLLSAQAESAWAAQRELRLERQLADALDLMTGALGMGAGLMAALEAAAREAKTPLRPLLQETLGRIRYGDDPTTVFRSLADRVRLETFLLFSTSLAVNWEVGGSLTATLSGLGRTIRDRIELSRKMRSNAIQAQLSVWAVLAATYFIGLVIWRTNPGQMRDFVRSPTASWLIAGSVILQAVGIAWMGRISRLRY